MKNSVKDVTADSIKAFASKLKGSLVLPSDANYDETRKVYNAMIDKRPGLFAMCETVDDVIASVNFGRENNILVAVRGGGHNGAGLGLCNDGLVIDLSGIKSVAVDTAKNTVKVGGGNIWNEVDTVTHKHGLAIPSGMISTTGVGGLTLGGGVGYLTRKYGLTIDNLIEAEMVLADGTLVTVNATNNTDLFWAIRGGGGNFGVVTSFTFQLHPVDTVIAGPMLWPVDELGPTLRWYREWLPRAPEDVYAFYQIARVPPVPIFPDAIHGEKACGLMWCCTGPEPRAKE